MYYFGARWYDAEAGRFAGVDPLLARPFNPQEVNAYSYVMNDPINLVDPTGMMGSTPTPGIEEITITGTRGGGGTSNSFGNLTFSFSAPRVRVMTIGASMYILTDVGSPSGTQYNNSGECCGDDQIEGGDASDSRTVEVGTVTDTNAATAVARALAILNLDIPEEIVDLLPHSVLVEIVKYRTDFAKMIDSSYAGDLQADFDIAKLNWNLAIAAGVADVVSTGANVGSFPRTTGQVISSLAKWAGSKPVSVTSRAIENGLNAKKSMKQIAMSAVRK
jgi:hypothetical protein